MGALLYQRRVRVTLIPSTTGDYKVGQTQDAIVVENLRVSFKVKKDLKPQPNPATIVISNLAPTTRAKLAQKGLRIILEAGYPNTIAQIFSGDISFVDSVHDGADWSTKMEATDGGRSFQFARANISLGEDTKIGQVIKGAAKFLGVDVGNLNQQADALQQNYAAGVSVQGRAADVMNSYVAAAGLEWSIQDGSLLLLKPGQPTGDQALDISPTSGLIGSPEHGTPSDKGGLPVIKVKSLLAPTCKPGALVNVHSDGTNGTFRIVSAEHVGDTHGGDWYTNLEVEAQT